MMPRVVGHRGYAARYAENTLPGFIAACRSGVIGVEFDVQLSRDEVPMVLHDRTLERIGHGPRWIGDVDAAELQAMDAAGWKDPALAGPGIPRLDEVLAAVPDREVWIEIKAYPEDVESGRALRAIACSEDAVSAAGAGDRARILCFHRETLDAARLPRVWNLKEPVNDRSQLRGVDAVDIDIERLTDDFAAGVRDAGLSLMTYTVNTRAQLDRAVACEVDAVITDDPAWAVEALRTRASCSNSASMRPDAG